MTGPPAITTSTEATRRVGHRVLRAGAVLTLILALLITLLLVGVEAGPVGLATGLVLAVVPVPIYVWLALRVDRYEPEPARALWWTFFWGATGAAFIALVLNSIGQAAVGSGFGADAGELYGGSISAPIVEEVSKGFVIFAIYRWRRSELNGVLDGIVYAAMVGLGFATTENIVYYSRAAVEGEVPLAATFFMRGVMSPFVHPVFTAMTGIGIGIAASTPKAWLRRVAPIAGIVGAMILHSLWNTSASVGDGSAFLGVYALVMVPLFISLIVVVLLASRSEGRTVAAELRPEVSAGALTEPDIAVLASLRERRRAEKAARRAGGRAARRTRRDFERTATELAFLRRRVRNGLPLATPDPAGDELALRTRMLALRAELPDAPAPRAAALTAIRPPVPPQIVRAGATRAAVGASAPGPNRRLTAAEAAAAALAPPAEPRVATSPQAGWYDDPWRAQRWRWWDGGAWTGWTAP
jgi:RsiW-degrading membrane proteinase PrsW (M82 family)